MPQSRSVRSQRRRRLLQLLGVAAGGSSLASIATARDDTESTYVAEQGEQCIPLTPLHGSETVEERYMYSFPHERFNAPSGFDGSTFSSEGTTTLQRDSSSILFLYEGPGGLSLVIVHGHVDSDTDEGGTVSFQIHGLPADGEWVVRDDYYLDEDGTQAESNYDRWDVNGEVHAIDWAYQSGRTDGGTFRDLDDDLHIRIEPAFNDAAALAADHEFGPIENWEVLSGDSEDPDRHSLRLDRPLVIRRGNCSAADRDESATDEDTSNTHEISTADRKEQTAETEEKEETVVRTEQEAETEREEKVTEENGEKKDTERSTGKGEKNGEKHGKENDKKGKRKGKENGKKGKENGKRKGEGNGRKNGKANGKGNGRKNGKKNGKGNGKKKGKGNGRKKGKGK